MDPKVSVIIRAKNEGRFLEQVLLALKNQTYQNFEVIVGDDHSTDKTREVAEKYNCRIITIPDGKFTYPFASNFTAAHARGKYLAFISGHSIPILKNWLEMGLKNFSDQKVAGVYSAVLANPESNLFEKSAYLVSYLIKKWRLEHSKIKQVKMGVLGATNAIIRRDLWEKHPFDEQFAYGGEDRAWAKYWVERGYKVIRDPYFRVYHSHNLGPTELLRQLFSWRLMGKPKQFQAQKNNLK